MSRGTRRKRNGESGFTLIEAVVALGLVTIVLAAIGWLVAANARGVRNLEQRVALVETTRLVATNMSGRAAFSGDDLGGETSEYRWQARATPFFDGGPVVPNSPWIPQLLELRVQSPSGAILSLTTVRLQKIGGLP